MKLIFNELYIFSPSEKKGKRIHFEEGLNIISSSQEDGANRGKSVVLRSLYHSLGAESLFESKFDAKNKVFILNFNVDDYSYWIYRSGNLYKLLDGQKQLISTATHSQELSIELKKITDFAVMLPQRENQKLEITPPVYNYLPYFLDQDHHEGSKFSSFDKLAQYQNYKESVLFYHMGVYDENYFAIVQQIEECEDKIAQYNKRKEILEAMENDIASKLEIGSISGDLSSLNKDVERHKRQYADMLGKLSRSKQKLIELRNNIAELELTLKETQGFEKQNSKSLKLLQNHICPECGSEISDTVTLKSKKYNIAEDTIVIKNDIQVSIHDIEMQISEEEQLYGKLLIQLNEYENRLKSKTKEVNDAIRYRGFCEIRDNIVEELSELNSFLSFESDKKKELAKKKKEYAERKRKVEQKYEMLLSSAKIRFGLAEINSDVFKKMSNNFSASGSDKDIATIMWYFSLIQLRNEFNPNAIKYPIVLDSPCNTETDEEREKILLDFLYENINLSPQMIMSGIGLDASVPKKMNAHIIQLQNDRYSLLTEQDFSAYVDLLNVFCNAGL